MNEELLFDYEAPNLEIIEMVLENGIAFTVTHESYEVDDLVEGDDLGTY